MQKKRAQMRTALALALVMLLSLPGLGGATALAAGQTTVHASNSSELEAAIDNLQSNTIIELDGGDYNCFMWLSGLENVTIQGTGSTRLVTDDGDDVVMYISNCKNLTLSGLSIGHDIPQDGGCLTGVINADKSVVNIVNCDIFGCGYDGLESYGSTLTVTDSTIRDCSAYILYLGQGTNATFQNCVFSGNAYKRAEYIAQGWGADTPAIYAYSDGAETVNAVFTDCTFINNQNPSFLSEDQKGVYITRNNCLFENNGWSTPVSNGTGATAATTAPSAPAQSAGVTANPTSATVLVNGVSTAFDAYTIDGSNYFKLRDLAYVLSGTEKQFEVGFDNATKNITLTSGQGYTAVGGEMTAGAAGSKSASPTASAIIIDGAEVSLTAYNIGGNNYFKLRDVGQAFDFGIGWDNATKTITIDTSTGYTA